MLGKLVSLKAMGIAIPAMALTASGAAAATGSLPAPAQSAVHGALAHIGVSVPTGDDTGSGHGKGPDVTGPAKFGLCNAYSHANKHAKGHSVAFANLEKAAGGAANVAAFCQNATPGNESTSGDTGSTGSNDTTSPNAGTNGHGKPTTPAGPPASTPPSGHSPVSTPAGPPSSTPAGKP